MPIGYDTVGDICVFRLLTFSFHGLEYTFLLFIILIHIPIILCSEQVCCLVFLAASFFWVSDFS